LVERVEELQRDPRGSESIGVFIHRSEVGGEVAITVGQAAALAERGYSCGIEFVEHGTSAAITAVSR
jgi:hypothetical protein